MWTDATTASRLEGRRQGKWAARAAALLACGLLFSHAFKGTAQPRRAGAAARRTASPAPAPVDAAAPRPWAEFAELPDLCARLVAAPGSPDAFLALLRLQALADLLGAGPIDAALRPHAAALAKAAFSSPSRALWRWLERDLDRRLGRRTAARNATDWRWLGPFDASDSASFERTMPFELEPAVQPPSHGRDGPLSWQAVPEAALHGQGAVDLGQAIERPGGSIVHLEAYVQVPAAGRWRVRLGAAGAARLIVDGQRVLELPAPRPTQGPFQRGRPLWAMAEAVLTLAPGAHRLHVKLLDHEGALPFVVDAEAEATQESPSPPGPGKPQPGPIADAAATPPSRPPPAADDWLAAWLRTAEGSAKGSAAVGRARAAGRPLGGRTEALAALAALAAQGWPFSAHGAAQEEAVNDALARGAEEDDAALGAPAAAALAAVAREPGDRAEALAAAVERWPALVWLRLRAIDALLAADRLEEASRVASHPSFGARPAGLEATLRRMELWQRAGGEVAVLSLLRHIEARNGLQPTLGARQLAARLRTAHDDLPAAATLTVASAEAEPGDRALALNALAALEMAGDFAALRRLRARAAATVGDASLGVEALARTELHAGDAVAAERTLRTLPSGRWRSGTFELLAKICSARQDIGATVAALQEAVRRAPGRRELRARLATLLPEPQLADLAATDLLGRGRAALELPIPRVELRTAFRRNAVRELSPGTLVRYEAEVLVVGRDGPRSHRMELEYVPSQSGAEVLTAVILRRDGSVVRGVETGVEQLGDGSSNLYYDLEQLWIRFADLQAGDVLVVETVVRDFVADPFRIVFGDLVFLGESRPIDALEVDIQLRPGAPLFAAVTGSQRQRFDLQLGGEVSSGRWLRLRGRDIAAVTMEAQMPAGAEVVPVLHASSFADWQGVTTHWAGLLRASQPAPGTDARVRSLALQLASGAADDEARIGRLYRFVADEIRYVGLEFGVHSLRPYPVADILGRKFGDCKDKATLLVALLAEVGIEARVSLVRTGDGGRVDPQIASLALFNHAIVWLPASDRYLDPTVRNHGPFTLPDGDLGGQALPVSREVRREGDGPPAGLRDIPWPTPEVNGREEALELTLRPDGSAALELTATLHGLSAAEAREALAVEGTRRERVERDLGTRFAGLQISDLEVTGATVPIDADALVVRLRGTVPALGQRDGGRWTLTPWQPQTALRDALSTPPPRQHPLLLPAPERRNQRLRLRLPPGWQAERLPAAATIAAPNGGLSLQLQVTSTEGGAVVEVRSSLRRAAARVAPGDLTAWHKALLAADAALGQPLVLGPRSAP